MALDVLDASVRDFGRITRRTHIVESHSEAYA
jgi:hypothetical protein